MKYDRARSIVQQIKQEIQKQTNKEIAVINLAIVREIDYLWRVKGKGSIKDFETILRSELNINQNEWYRITQILKNFQEKVQNVWSDYFDTAIPAIEYEKLSAVTNINFYKLGNSVKAGILNSFAQNKNLTFEQIRQVLINTNKGKHVIYTEANTFASQYDNAILTATAMQAGINSFLYDGPIQKNTRPFCLLHVGKIYTLAELKKMDNGQGLPVETSLGGWNCEHYLTAYFKS